MDGRRVLFAYGGVAMPGMVDSFERARGHALADAVNTGLQHPELPTQVICYMHLDGLVRQRTGVG